MNHTLPHTESDAISFRRMKESQIMTGFVGKNDLGEASLRKDVQERLCNEASLRMLPRRLSLSCAPVSRSSLSRFSTHMRIVRDA